jgi:carbonic anhydrase/acetyltransferase-like protein (isoleucine patch superfamily)
MPLYDYFGRTPKIGEGSFIHDSAEIIGDVVIGNNCYVGCSVIVKGDYVTVRIGDRVIIEDKCVIHGNAGETVTIGNDVIIGHGCIIHSCTIKDGALIGMGAIISDSAVVGENSIVGEGSVVIQRTVIPPRKIVIGAPAKVARDVTDERLETLKKVREKYLEIYAKYGSLFRKL